MVVRACAHFALGLGAFDGCQGGRDQEAEPLTEVLGASRGQGSLEHGKRNEQEVSLQDQDQLAGETLGQVVLHRFEEDLVEGLEGGGTLPEGSDVPFGRGPEGPGASSPVSGENG